MSVLRMTFLVAVAALLSSTSSGEALGLEVRTDSGWNESATTAIGSDARVYRFYAVFDGVSDYDRVVQADTDFPYPIRVDDDNDHPNARIYQNPLGGDRPSNQMVWDIDPSAQWDSYVTLGPSFVTSENASRITLYHLEWLDGDTAGDVEKLKGAWFVSAPGFGFGTPSVSEDGLARLLLAQITVVFGCEGDNPQPTHTQSLGADPDALGDTVIKSAEDRTQRLFSGSFQIWTPAEQDGGIAVRHVFDLQGLFPAPPVEADVNRDYFVDAADLAHLIGAWGSSNPEADLTSDCIVDAHDLAQLLSYWGEYQSGP